MASAGEKNNVQVCLRFRPMNSKQEKNEKTAWKPTSNSVTELRHDRETRNYTYDHIFGPTANTQDVYNDVGEDLVNNVLQGINGTLFAYGQTSCGKTFTKMDSLKRHIAENHKGVRPFACSLCDKTYGRRDYLQRHLKSHNANYAVNLQSASNISASQVVQKVQVHQPHHSINHHSPSKNTIILQQGQGGTLQVVSSNSAANSSATQSGSGGSRYVH